MTIFGVCDDQLTFDASAAFLGTGLSLSLVASALIAHAAAENASPWPMASIVCYTLATFATLSAALRPATVARGVPGARPSARGFAPMRRAREGRDYGLGARAAWA